MKNWRGKKYWGPEPLDEIAWAEFAGRLRPEEETALLLAALAGSRKILDVGGGTGVLTRAVAREFGACTVVEPSAVNAAAIPRDAGKIELIRGRAEELPFADGSFDAVMATWVLQYTRDPACAVREMARVCATESGARVVLIQAAPENELVALYNVCAEVAGCPLSGHDYLLGLAASVLEEAGFEEIQLTRVPVRLEFPERDLESRIALCASVARRMQHADHPAAARMEERLRQRVARIFERTPHSLNDDGVMLVARSRR